MVGLMEFVVPTQADTGYINITQKVEQLVESSGIGSGTAFIITAHTTTGITVNEALECLQSDMCEAIAALAPECASTAMRACCIPTGNPRTTRPPTSAPC